LRPSPAMTSERIALFERRIVDVAVRFAGVEGRSIRQFSGALSRQRAARPR
jgi:hypothetical protein